MAKIKNWVMAGGVVAVLALAVAAGSALSTYPGGDDARNLLTTPNLLATETPIEVPEDQADPSS